MTLFKSDDVLSEVFTCISVVCETCPTLIIFLQKAKKKPIAKKTAADLGVDVTPRHEILSVEDPPVRQAGQKVRGQTAELS